MSCDPASRAGAVLDIDLGAVVANWRLLAERAAPAECAAVVKANAYGLGAEPVARALARAGGRLFFVATLDEGIALRRALAQGSVAQGPEIAVLNGPFPGTAAEFVAHDLIPVLNHPGQIEEWSRTRNRTAGVSPAQAKPGVTQCRPGAGGPSGNLPPAILHVDTGMARL